MTRETIAWIGLGRIGLPMAGRIAAQGFSVRGFDLDPSRREAAKARGIQAAKSAADAVTGADFVFTSLTNDQALKELLLGKAGLLDRIGKHAILVETSTTGPAASADIARATDKLGIPYLRAPISGSTALAAAGTLTTFVSGPEEAFDRVLPVFEAYTRAQMWLGPDEEARYAKLALNLMVAVTAGMLAEAMVLARKGGIEWSTMLDVVGQSVLNSPIIQYKLGPLRRRDFTPSATTSLISKDLDLIVSTAKEVGVTVPLASHMSGLFAAMQAKGLGEQDFFRLVQETESAAGLTEA